MGNREFVLDERQQRCKNGPRGKTHEPQKGHEEEERERPPAKTGKLLHPDVAFVTARRIGGETVQYVSNIYKYYIAYKLITEAEEERAKEMGGIKAP